LSFAGFAEGLARGLDHAVIGNSRIGALIVPSDASLSK
jgi:hypothetical protein